VINAVYNYRNFWDGRAQNAFNGTSPIGFYDGGAFLLVSNPSTGLMLVSNGEPAHQIISIANAALASQAVGPPNNGVEMSYAGRNWKKLGKKMLSLSPLSKQLVAVDDSVLGPYSNQLTAPGMPGISKSYGYLIATAFQPKWWNSNQLVDVNGNFIMTTVKKKQVIKTGSPTNTNEYSLMEYNFSMFWGLAIQLYESTLLANDSRLDQYFDGNTNALTSQELLGLSLFTGKGNCNQCHMGPEMTDAAVANQSFAKESAPGNPAPGFHMIGVRPVAEDIATQSGAPGGIFNATKTPALRDVELTAPYFHNGGQLTLEQVVQFYSRAGDFGTPGVDQDAEILPLGLTTDEIAALAAFLRSLTDQRVVQQSAPFDHPSIDIPNGASGNNLFVTQNGQTGVAVDDPATMLHIPAVGKLGTTTPYVPFGQGLQ
jgi:cytochrome c peroxidase